MRVLLIEDDRRLAASLQRGLGESGLAVDVVHEGEDGVAAATTVPYDAVILDLMLPGADGFAISRELRQRKVSTPILMLTARDAVDDRVRGLEAGADDYMVKPFAMRELIARIRALARRHLPDRTSVLTAGSIVLDTAAHSLRVRDQEVELTAKEFAILDFFLHNPGRLLTRRQIIEHVWDYDFEGGNNLVEVYMGRLRRKLIAAGAGDPFVTVRGSGYRLEARK
ncbi:MAG TPA: response regulator transcription factor [Candidatus Limnocylindrales bacterium]|nr:response regulator transcription factor [Candidatus Limnocylindrales bacterium]